MPPKHPIEASGSGRMSKKSKTDKQQSDAAEGSIDGSNATDGDNASGPSKRSTPSRTIKQTTKLPQLVGSKSPEQTLRKLGPHSTSTEGAQDSGPGEAERSKATGSRSNHASVELQSASAAQPRSVDNQTTSRAQLERNAFVHQPALSRAPSYHSASGRSPPVPARSTSSWQGPPGGSPPRSASAKPFSSATDGAGPSRDDDSQPPATVGPRFSRPPSAHEDDQDTEVDFDDDDDGSGRADTTQEHSREATSEEIGTTSTSRKQHRRGGDVRNAQGPDKSSATSERHYSGGWNATKAASARVRRSLATESCNALEEMLRQPEDPVRIARTTLLSRALHSLIKATEREKALVTQIRSVTDLVNGAPVPVPDWLPTEQEKTLAASLADARSREERKKSQLKELLRHVQEQEKVRATTAAAHSRVISTGSTQSQQVADGPAREAEQRLEQRLAKAEEENRLLKAGRWAGGMDRERALESRVQAAQEELVRLRRANLAEGRDRERLLESRLKQVHEEIERLRKTRLQESLQKEQNLMYEISDTQQVIRDIQDSCASVTD